MTRSTSDAVNLAAPPPDAPYRDPSLPIEARVADLVARMTPEEKVAQLGSLWAFDLLPNGALDGERLADLLACGLGELTRLAGSTSLSIGDVVSVGNGIQRYLLEETRLGIPAILHEETLHGLMSLDAPRFQQAIGAAATFDPEVLGSMASTIRRRMVLSGARHALAPVLDTTRDPRWGRIEETYGEDPYLAAAMGVAYIRGIQGERLEDGVMAMAKHLVGHGLAEGGRNQNPAHLGSRELRDEQLFAFEAAVRAGVASVMPAYCEVDGVPCHASSELLTDILRGEWGFDGLVSSDYLGIEMISTQHRLCPDLSTAGALALSAGVDQELPRLAAFGQPLLDALALGRIEQPVLDAAVARVLRAKFQLGLFERPYVAALSPADLECLIADEQTVAAELARRSLVLLENDGTLPLSPALRRVAVLGSMADSARDLVGDYSHLVHLATLLEMRAADNAFGIVVHDGVEGVDELAGRPTILDALRERLAGVELRYAAGAGITATTDAELAAAVDAARWAEIAIVVVGERSGLTSDSTTGEFRDRLDLALLGRQQELLESVVATGTPVVLVVVSGRPLSLEWASRHCAAILYAWVPGDAGPAAIADTLVGRAAPGGKLPVTFPRSVGQIPLTYRRHPSGGRSHWKGDYVDGPVAPLWPFGFGRSYTTFHLSNLRIGSPVLATEDGELMISVDVENTGTRAGDEVVQLYARDEGATVARPVLELLGFRRISLDAGTRTTVTFRVASEQFAYTGRDHHRVVEPGFVRLAVGTSSADLPLCDRVELVGPIVEVPTRRRFITEISVG